MSEISPALARALKRGDAPLLMLYLDHPTAGEIRVHSRTGILEYDGHDWIGFGTLGRISGATRSVNLTINDVAFELRGVPPTTTDLLGGEVRNRVAKVWRAALSARGRLTVDDDPTIDALLDNQTLKVDPSNGEPILSIRGVQGFYVLDRAQDLAWSDQQQRYDFPDDCGLALCHEYENRESKWRKTDPP